MRTQALWVMIPQDCGALLKGERIGRLGSALPKRRWWITVETGALVNDFSRL